MQGIGHQRSGMTSRGFAAMAQHWAGKLSSLVRKPQPLAEPLSVAELAQYWSAEQAKPRVFDDVAIVALGGSATYGFGVADSTQSFIFRVSEDVSRELNAPLHLTNLSVPDASLEEVLTEQVPQLTTTGEPDIVVCCLDPDQLVVTPMEDYLGQLDALAKALPTGSVIAEMPRASDPLLDERGAEVNLRLRRIARQRGHIVAAIRDFQGLASIYTNAAEMAIGTNATMDHALWADAMWTAIWASSRFEELR